MLSALMMLALVAQAVEPLTPLVDLTAWVTGLGASLVWGAAKKWTGALDTKVGHAIKPVQPVLVGALAVALPFLSNAIGITDLPPADVIAAAPSAAIVGVTAREIFRRLVPRRPSLF